jgi:sucrose-6-phosphate hydrolase SacC (GH32 family)
MHAFAPIAAPLFVCLVFTSIIRAAEDDQLLFAYFKNNGEDGLHLAHSEDGYKWTSLKGDKSFLTPTAGKDKLMRDPSILLGPDGKFHMVWTVSWKERGIGYASSDDLIHWSEQQTVPVMEHESTAINCWAPELFYDDATKQYFIFWATTIPGRFPATDGQSDKMDGVSLNHRIYYVTTKDFKDFSKASVLYDHDFNVIDAAIIKSGDKYVMILKNETNKPLTPQKNIRLAFADHAEGPWSKASPPITGEYWAEGPTGIKIGHQWFVYFDKYRDHKYGLLVSEDLRNWTDKSDQLAMPHGMRHGTAFRAPKRVVDALKEVQN